MGGQNEQTQNWQNRRIAAVMTERHVRSTTQVNRTYDSLDTSANNECDTNADTCCLSKNFVVLQASFRTADVSQNITKYVDTMAKLVQAVVTSKAFKKNRTKHPFSDWETVSDEAFLILCLGNYEKTWRAKKLRVNNGPPPPSGHEVEDPY
jgi:hypothetical protein